MTIDPDQTLPRPYPDPNPDPNHVYLSFMYFVCGLVWEGLWVWVCVWFGLGLPHTQVQHPTRVG